MYVIGTAGHVDHGKSALVQALTGIDPDRLREEKERGLTIDLGFAWLRLPSGQEVSIVDVPGHERFIKNMLAGVGGIDLALLVIAADEGVMPQTREHLAILDLLGIEHGVIVITKADLVDAEWLELVQAEAMAALRGTTLERSPLIACSAVTGAGLAELVATLQGELDTTPPKRDIGRPRLPIDRAFTIAGFGTVVTGTLIDGSLEIGQEVEIVPARPAGGPGGLRSRIRGLHSHGRKADKGIPGRRTAVNLAGIAVEELERGMVVTTPGWLKPTTAVDVRLRAVSYLPRPIRHSLTVSFHTGSAEVEGRVLLLDRDQLPPGEMAWAQIRLAQSVAVAKGDRFVIRDPNDTLGGGKVVDTHVRRHRRFHAPTLETLATLERGSPQDMLLLTIGRLEPVALQALSREVELSPQELQASVEGLIAEGRALALDEGPLAPDSILYTADGFTRLGERAKEAVAFHHRQHPLRAGMPKEELRTRLGPPAGRAGLEPRAFDQALAVWIKRGDLMESAPRLVGMPGHRPRLSHRQEEQAEAFLRSLEASPYAPPTDALPEPELVAYLEEQGQVVPASQEVVFAASAYREMVERIVSHLQEKGTITLAQVRDMFGTSRKYAQALLEHMDQQRITRRVGDQRVLRIR